MWNLAEDGDVKAMQNRVDQNDLLEHVNDLDTSGKTALHFACYANRLEVALFLLKCGASVAIKDCNGKTPIDIAMSRGHTQMADEIHAATASNVWLLHVVWNRERARELVAAGAGLIAAAVLIHVITRTKNK